MTGHIAAAVTGREGDQGRNEVMGGGVMSQEGVQREEEAGGRSDGGRGRKDLIGRSS